MNVLLVTALVAGGVGRHVQLLTEGLVGRGHRVVVAAPAEVSRRFGLEALGATCVDLPVSARPGMARDRAAVATLRAVSRGADVVHAHGLRAGALTSLALPPGGTSGPRFVVTTHNAPPAGLVGRAVYAVTERLACRRADLVLAVSPDLLVRARRAGARAAGLAVVPAAPGPPLSGERRTVLRDRVRRELGLGTEDRPLLVVNAGRLAPQKDQAALVDAFDQLVTTGEIDPAPVLVLAGEGPERTTLEARASTSSRLTDVRLLGHRDDVLDLLASADLVVSSAVWEGQPVWLQEALQVGAPVVATDVGGTALVLGGAGVLVEPGPGLVERLAAALREVLRDDTVRARLRVRALQRAAELPTATDALEAVLTAYLVGPPQDDAPQGRCPRTARRHVGW
ncbi:MULTISPECIES: glycosyltransferase family 4 protein [unclassified Ornithinimicrobium]|uniref:glycosyltransferase family 4 protein n=1 Tax=unclassified Ornithinimicrobium TaxID=2615080 RepID=UPI003851DB64